MFEELVFNTKSETDTPNDKPKVLLDGGPSPASRPPRPPRVWNEEKIKQLSEKYAEVCVHDFGDDYHLPEEERVRKNKFYSAFQKVMRCKRKFRKIDEYIKAFRISMECLKLVAENNGVYDPEDFITKVMKKDIKVYGLTFPKYIGKDRKYINWSYVTEFILDTTKDVQELVSKSGDEYLEEMSDAEAYQKLLSPEQRARIEEIIERRNNRTNAEPAPFIGDDPFSAGIVQRLGKKASKEFIKDEPGLFRVVREAEKQRKRINEINRRLGTAAFEINDDDYEAIAKMDRARGIASDDDYPEFKGDAMNPDDVNRYMHEVRMYELTHTKQNYQGKMRTLEEIREIQLKDALDEGGWNVRKLYNAKDKEKKLKHAQKEARKHEEAIKKRLLALQGGSGKGKAKLEFDSRKGKKGKKKGKKSKKEDD